MNKHRFRLVFSRVLGFLIPVAETTRAQRKSGQTQGPAPVSATRLAVSVLLAGLPTWVAADILVDAANPSGTHVISAANGVPVIEIAAPNSKGLSHNRFSEFDVKNPGLIFNNSLVNGQSQIGGALLKNPNLQRSATAILSEVTGNKPSAISGTLEVFGAKADLFIASPNGVTLNGVTTLNTSSLTVSTGHVRNADSALQFLVDDTSGKVIVGAEGVNTAGLSYFDIVARSVALQGKLGSDALLTDLNVTAGQGIYDAASGAFTAKHGPSSGVAIAGSAAGAMHGRYINLISSDSGAGVRQDGLILAAKDIAISAAGDIQLTTTTAKGNVQIGSTASFINAGALEANTSQIKARDVLNQKGASLGGTNGLAIEADKSVTNKGGELLGSTVSVKADSILNTDQGQIVGTDIALTAQTAFTHDGKASIVAANNLYIDTNAFSAADGELLAGHNLTLAADRYQNSATIRSKNNASLTLKHGNDLVIDNAFKGPSADGLLLLSARDVTITDELNSAGSVAIDALGDVRNQGAVIVGKTLGITARGLIDNQAGKLIWTGETLRLEAGTQLLNGVDSQILSMGDMSLSAGENVQNNTGRIEAQKSVWLDAPLVENLSQSSGGIKAVGMANEDTLYAEKYGDWGETQYFHTKIDLPLYASDLTVKQAVIKAGGDLLFNPDKAKDAATKVRNVGGLIAATGNVLVEGDLENLGLSTTRSLVDMLRDTPTRTQWTVSSIFVANESPAYESLYDLLQRRFGGNSSDQWVNSLKKIKSPEVNQLISAVLGADWKALNQKQLQPRWAAFKAVNKTQTYYANQQAEISAGKTFQQDGGSFSNRDGANWGAQRPITIQVGSETVKSLDGELDAQFNATRADADRALKAQLDNPLFQRNQSGGAFGRIKPLYETRAKYLDQRLFLGSDYFLQKIGYDPGKTVSVLGDAYFDNQLILQNVEQRLGNFFAQTQRISGTDLAKQLLDNGAALAVKAGLTLGEPLSDTQIAGLDKDVVWYENRDVDGQLVLAPRVYLSQKTLVARDKDARSSALVAGDTVLIDANAVNNVNGTVRGTTDAFIYAKTDINNVSGGGAQAGFFAGQGGKDEKAGQLVIAAEGTVNNQGGVMSGYEQTVVGGKGISSSATTGYDKNGYTVVRDNGILGTALSADMPKEEAKPSTEPATIGDTAKPADKGPQKVAAPDVRAIFNERLAAGPVDTTQGSSLNVISGGNIDLTAAITQSDNVSLQSSGDLNLNDLHEARSAFDSINKSGFLSSVQITEMASSANSVGNTLNAKNLQIKTGGDLNITGGEINAQNSAIEVAGSSTINAGKDLAFHEKTTKTTQLVIGAGAGAGGYEATGLWGTAEKVDTQLGGAFEAPVADDATSVGVPAVPSSVRAETYAGRGAASQTLATNGTGARAGANKGRGSTSGANFKIGMETVTTTDTSESVTYRNAQLNLGNGSLNVGKTLDIGGADINAGHQLSAQERAKMTPEQRKAVTDGMPTLAITAGDIKTTKVENTEKTTHTRDELFIGVTAEAHSSAADVATQAANLAHKALGTDVVKDPNAPAGSSKTLATEDREMEVDKGLTALAAVGMASQLAFGEVAGGSVTVGIKHTEQKSDSSSRSENINQLGGNISLTSTKGDIELNGVNLQGGKVGIKSAGNLTQRAAKSSSVSHDETNTQSAGLTLSAGVAPTGVGAGVSVGMDGSGDTTTTTSTSYSNGLISGTEVSIETKGDHTLLGSNIKGNQVAVKVGGNQTISSVQDTSDMTHDRYNWSISTGLAVTTNGLANGTSSASFSAGKDYDNSRLVAEQAGINGDTLALNVAGNLNLTGAQITSQKGQGTVQVGGKINAQTLRDSREKDGGYGGGGGGISKNGLASVSLEFGRVDQVHYAANNAATIDVGDPGNVTAAKGVNGPLNTNADNQLDVIQNKRVAGTDVKIDLSAGDLKSLKAKVKKVFSPRVATSHYVADAPGSRGAGTKPVEKSAPQADTTRAVPNVYGDAPQAKPKFDQRVVVNTDANDPTVARAVQNLVNKNPGTVVVEPAAGGGHKVTQGTLTNGTTKVEVVGHGNGSAQGGLDGTQITDVLESVVKDGNTTLNKVALVGCKTGCSTEGNSLVNQVKNQLLERGHTPQVKGYDTAVAVDDAGRKQVARSDSADALGKTDPALLRSKSEPNLTQNVELYHLTPQVNMGSIVENGLSPAHGGAASGLSELGKGSGDYRKETWTEKSRGKIFFSATEAGSAMFNVASLLTGPMPKKVRGVFQYEPHAIKVLLGTQENLNNAKAYRPDPDASSKMSAVTRTTPAPAKDLYLFTHSTSENRHVTPVHLSDKQGLSTINFAATTPGTHPVPKPGAPATPSQRAFYDKVLALNGVPTAPDVYRPRSSSVSGPLSSPNPPLRPTVAENAPPSTPPRSEMTEPASPPVPPPRLKRQQRLNTQVDGGNTALVADAQHPDQPAVHTAPNAPAQSTPTESATPPARRVNLIDNAQKTNKINAETGSFLTQATHEISKQLETGPVLIGEDHRLPDSHLLLRQLIADGKINHVMYESDGIPALKNHRDYPATLKKLREQGYSSVEDYLSRSKKLDGTKDAIELQDSVLNLISRLVNPNDPKNPYEWRYLLTDAVKSGVKQHFIDKKYEKNGIANTMHSRNKYMAKHIKNSPELNGPGVIGVFGADHIRPLLQGSTIKKGLHQLASVDEARTYDITPAFSDNETGQSYSRWDELTRQLIQPAKPRQPLPPPVIDETRKPSIFHRAPYYAEAKYKNRIIIDQVNTQKSADVATRLLEKNPENTVLLTQSNGTLAYKQGVNRNDPAHQYEGKKTKVYVLSDPSQRPDESQITAGIRKKYGHDLGTFNFSLKPVTGDAPAHATETEAPPIPSRKQPVQPDAKETSTRFIDQAQEQQRIGAETASFLKQVKQEMSEKLATGPVLIGEAHDLEASSLLINQLIADGHVTHLMHELPGLTEYLKNLSDYPAVLKKLREQGYPSIEDYLKSSRKRDETRKASELKDAVLTIINKLVDPNDKTLPYSWNETFTTAANKGIKQYFVDKRTSFENDISSSGIHMRNKHIAKQIKKYPELNGPGVIGLFGAEHLRSILKDSNVKPGIHGLANIDESRTFDISPAFVDQSTGEMYPRWPELNRHLTGAVGPRQSTHPAFMVDTTKKPSLFHPAPYYVEATYKNRIIIDQVNSPESMSLADAILKKHPYNTISFTKSAGTLNYKEGNSLNAEPSEYYGKKTKIYVLSKPDNWIPDVAEMKDQLKEKFGHPMGILKIRPKVVNGAETAQLSKPEKGQ